MYLFFDTETTGLSRHSDHVVQVAWVLADEDGDIVSETCHVIRPKGYSIPWQAAQIHGISTAIAKDIGKPLDWVLEQLSEDVREASVVVAHNLSFDLGILQNDYKNAGLVFPFHGKTQVCTMRLSTTWCRLPKLNGSPGFKYPKLEELHYRLFGEAFDDAHDALADTQACMRCYFELVEQGVIEAPPTKRKAVRSTTTSNPPISPQRQTSANISKEAPAVSKPPEPPSLASRLAYLATHHDPEVRIGVATNLDCPAEVQMLLAEDADVRVVTALAANPSCSKEVFAQLAKDVELDVLAVLAGNQSCSSDVLSDLYDRFNEELAKVLVCNPSCPPAVLADICWFGLDDVAAAAHANPSFSKELFEDLLSEKLHDDTDERSFLAERSDCPPDFLRQLALDDSWVVRKYVARNPATPPDELLRLSRIVDMNSEEIEDDDLEENDGNDEKIDQADDEDLYPFFGPVHVRYYANQNPSNPLNEARLAETSERLAELAKHDDSEVRSLVARNENTSAGVLAAMATDFDMDVRKAVASNVRTPTAQLSLLSTDNSGDVRSAVAGNLRCPMNLFATLCSDKSAAVRLAAANNPNCSIAGLKVLAGSEFYEYRRLAAKHKNCTRDLFEALANDHVPSVRQAVVENNDCPIGIRAPLFMVEKSRSKETVRNENKRIFDALSAKYFEEDIGLSKPFVQARKLPLDSLINDSDVDVDELGDGLVEACSLAARDEIMRFEYGSNYVDTHRHIQKEHVEEFGDDLIELMQRLTKSVLFGNECLFIDQTDIDKYGVELVSQMYRVALMKYQDKSIED